jgi:hypothetical protein
VIGAAPFRDGWIADRAADPVTRGAGWLFPAASVLALAALAVVLMPGSAAWERTRAVGQLRFVGTPRAAAAWVAWLESAIPASCRAPSGSSPDSGSPADGEPTAHLMPEGDAWFTYPPPGVPAIRANRGAAETHANRRQLGP